MVLRKCEVCDRRFKKTEHFKRHERSHTKERPYECQICHKRFSRSDVLSRHAKGHNKDATGGAGRRESDTATKPVQGQGSSAMVSASPTEPMTENAAPFISTIDTRMQDLSMPRNMVFPPAGAHTSSLNFLANISAHHSRTGPDCPTLMHDSQPQPYYGWNPVNSGVETIEQNSIGLEGMPNEVLQSWLEPRTEPGSIHNFRDVMHGNRISPTTEQTSIMTDHHSRQLGISDGTDGTNIPIERFFKVQRCWLTPLNHTGRLMNSLWRNIAQSEPDNLFSEKSPRHQLNSEYLRGSRYGIDEECRRRLQAAFSQPFNLLQNEATTSHTSGLVLKPGLTFPPAEILDMSLDLYFRTFHPLVPFIHLPTFSAKDTRPSLLYVMCLIGMMLLGTKGTAKFVSENFPHVLGIVTSEVAKCTAGTDTSTNTISIFATALLFLNLALLTGEKVHLEQCQMLHVNLLSLAQRHGLFAATDGQLLDMDLFENTPNADDRWKTWSKVESTKRTIIGLLFLDACYSSLLSTSPITVPDSIQLIMPCNEALFKAHSSAQWTRLIQSGERILMPTVLAPSEQMKIPSLEGSLSGFSIQAVLAMVQLRQSEAYYRLLSNRPSYPFAPCHTFAMDGRARCLLSLHSQIANDYSEALGRAHPNATVMWHHMCMMLTADIQIFELAAGRAGPVPAREALDNIAEWSQTPAARRACLHAAHIYKTMIDRKASDHPTSQSVYAVFAAALVLGLYTYMVPNATNNSSSTTSIELMDDIDWGRIGTEGFTSFMEPRGRQSTSPTDDPAVNFIRNGASIYLRSVPFQGGYQSARRILLDYANLLKDSGKWGIKNLSYVLHIMSDVLLDVE